MKEIAKHPARRANRHRHLEGKYLRIVGKYLVSTDRHNVATLKTSIFSSAALKTTDLALLIAACVTFPGHRYTDYDRNFPQSLRLGVT
jgi:hypothetical protein